MTFIEKIRFYVHRSLFIQSGLLLVLALLVFSFVHWKFKKYSEANLEKLKNSKGPDEKCFIVGDNSKLSTDQGNNKNKTSEKNKCRRD